MKLSRLSPFRLRRRKLRKDRTPYYLIDLPTPAARFIMDHQAEFIAQFSRDYEDEDPQFWQLDSITVPPRPIPWPNLDAWLNELALAMRRTRHPAAQIHAMLATRTIIFGCGVCFDLDHCDLCNFRSVPEAWTAAWKNACHAHDKWAPHEHKPELPTTEQAMAIMARNRQK